MSDWFIIRTAGRSTLPLARSLGEDGYEVWTPVRKQLIRVPRMNVRREVVLPLLPSFVFAKSPHLHDLLGLASMSEKPRRDPNGGRQSRPAHRDFSVFHYLDQIPMIADHDLDPLRHSETMVVLKKDLPRFDRGARVRATKGIFGGMIGRVERSGDGYALVIFDGGNKRTRIHTWLLKEDEAVTVAKPSLRAA